MGGTCNVLSWSWLCPGRLADQFTAVSHCIGQYALSERWRHGRPVYVMRKDEEEGGWLEKVLFWSRGRWCVSDHISEISPVDIWTDGSSNIPPTQEGASWSFFSPTSIFWNLLQYVASLICLGCVNSGCGSEY